MSVGGGGSIRRFWLAMLALLVAGPPAAAEIRLDAKRELQLIEQGRSEQRLPNIAYRVAIFSFEDPDRTGLGSALAGLAGRTVLTRAQVMSLGVLRYEGDLSPEAPGAPAYFDKVARIVDAQHVAIAIWGRVRRSQGRLSLDTYLQIPDEMLERSFTWRLPLPARMGGGELRARLSPSRIAVQRLNLPESTAGDLHTAAQALDQLRSGPDASAPVTFQLPLGQVYTLEEIRGQWVRLRLDSQRAGWSHVPSCPEPCAPFLDAARFAGAMLRYMASGPPPDVSATLTVDARAAADQIHALATMGRSSGSTDALSLAQRWLRSGVRPTADEPETLLAAGGATFANIVALNRTANLLLAAYDREAPRPPGLARGQPEPLDREVWSRLAPGKAAVGNIARQIAGVAALHPGDSDLLHNLAVLFDYAGDATRAAAARRLSGERR